MDRRSFIRLCAYSSLPLLLPFPAYARVRCDSLGPFVPTLHCVAELNASFAGVNIDASAAHRSQWCWAACIEMIFRYQGHPVSMERIVHEVWGDIEDMPLKPEQILQDLHRPWQDDNGVAFTACGEAVSPYGAMQKLTLNQPLIVGTQGDVMALTALTYLQNGEGPISVQAATVQDPWSGRGRHKLASEAWHHRDFLVALRATVAPGGSGTYNG